MVKRRKAAKEEIKEVKKEVVEDGDFFCDDVVLTKEQLLEIKNSHLERECINKDTKIFFTEIQLLDRQKELSNLRMSDMKARATMKDRDHKDLIEDIGRKVGVSLLDSQINFETGKVTFS